MLQAIGLGLVSLSVLIWLWLLCLRGQFWRSDVVLEQEQKLETNGTSPDLSPSTRYTPHSTPSFNPSLCAIIPARNEAELLPITLRSLLLQSYPGAFKVILVDDHSTDGTAAVAKQTAAALGKLAQLQVISAQPLPAGWSGKLWAMHQGIQASEAFAPDYLLLTDADIEHDPANLRRLVTKAIQQNLDLASIMVRLRCESFWEQLLIPAFVFFFEKLYPFRWVNDPQRVTAAAAGGCILLRKTALDRIGGLQTIRQALIDDCALAQAVKGKALYPIWLGLSDCTCSLRSYPSLRTIWEMIARTAFTQLNYSFILLMGTVLGMLLVYAIPVIGWGIAIVTGNHLITLVSLAGWVLMSFAYLPTVRFYQRNPILAMGLPLIASLYTLMTLDSAIRYWQGRGGAWKGRVYPSQSQG